MRKYNPDCELIGTPVYSSKRGRGYVFDMRIVRHIEKLYTVKYDNGQIGSYYYARLQHMLLEGEAKVEQPLPPVTQRTLNTTVRESSSALIITKEDNRPYHVYFVDFKRRKLIREEQRV
jgi:hypothetical protein